MHQRRADALQQPGLSALPGALGAWTASVLRARMRTQLCAYLALTDQTAQSGVFAKVARSDVQASCALFTRLAWIVYTTRIVHRRHEYSVKDA